ncbi:DUF4304 domain-containing protein [Cellulomonas endometrii]|uniref:DUF4304 domain-containing protein n=1 Tax=Cellulomonas endometrii TaxID=3036301 RepID=UPI0024AE21F7|nr:DUF4304 domain-containing protein [Cellulomonas endometrii]
MRPDATPPSAAGTTRDGEQPTLQRALRTALRDLVGPSARAHGYRGTAPSWRKVSSRGDWAVVNVQSSQFSTGELLPCVVNLSLIPGPWLDWCAASYGTPVPRAPHEAYGLVRERLHPTGAAPGVDVWWEVTHPDQARDVAADIVRRLEGTGWPLLEQLLDRDRLLGGLRSGEPGPHRARAEAALLCDEGPSAALDDLLAEALLGWTHPAHREQAEHFVTWARARAAAALL